MEFYAPVWCHYFPSSHCDTWLLFTQVMAMLSVVSLKQISPHYCLRKSHILHGTFQFSVVSLPLDEFDVWQVMATTRLSTFPGWMRPAE